MKLFQCSVEVVRLDVGVYIGLSKVSLSPPTVIRTRCISLFLGLNVADDAAICDLGVLGDFVPVDEKSSGSSMYIPEALEKSSNII